MQAVAVEQMSVAWAGTGPGRLPTALAGSELSSKDRLRAAGFGVDRRREFMVGRSLIAGLVGSLFPEATGWTVGTGVCRRCGDRHGPAEITGVPALASVTYAGGVVIVAVAPTQLVGRLGIDAELDAIDTTRTRDLERLLGRSREPVLRRWTRIEAVLKADGRGLLVDPGTVRLRPGVGRVLGEPARYRVADVAGPTGYLISLAWCDVGSSAAESGRATC